MSQAILIQNLNLQTHTEEFLYQELLKAKAEIEKLRDRADRDALTGCLRREAFLDLVATRRQMGMLPKNMTFVIADIDHFKKVNDTHGHGVGDEALKLFAEGLRNNSPRGTLICRMGGEEFCLLLEGSLPQTLEALESLRQKTTEILVPGKNGSFRMSASFGAAPMNSDEDLLKVAVKADLKLYQAKNGGRNRIAA
jgi:diguanylate cyclase (GGDEF)-like protein